MGDMTSTYRASIHLVFSLFDGGRLVMRDTLVYTRAAERWHTVSTGGVVVPSAAHGASPLPSPERAHISLTVMSGGELRCTIFGFKGRLLRATSDASSPYAAPDVRAVRFTRAAMGFSRAAKVDLFADPDGAPPVGGPPRAWRVSTFAKLNDAFLREILFP
jgi:hypothetical protein